MQDPTCPKCEKQKDMRTSHVPLGHGRHSIHVCPRCRILFEWGYNKFGNIESIEDITRYKELQEDEKVKKVSKGKGQWQKIEALK